VETGTRVIFLPEQPGVYLALCIQPNLVTNTSEELSDTQSTSSHNSSSLALVQLKKHIFAADHFLDLGKLPSKTQTILKKFEMIVIARVVNVVEQSALDESININFAI